MATLTIHFTPPATVPINGYIVRYRIKNSSDPYSQPLSNAFSSPAVIPNLAAQTNYEGYIMADCGFGASVMINFQTDVCFCPDGFTASPDGSYCYQIDTVAPTISSSNVCFAPVTNIGNYSLYGARVYRPGLPLAQISQDISSSISTIPAGDLDAVIQNSYWQSSANPMNSPMNKAGVWLDSDCNGTVNGLTNGSQATVAWSYFNPGAARQVYVGVAADNQFILQVNNTTIAQTTDPSANENFRNWHLIPITLVNGNNIVNIIATGDGSTNDCVAFAVYDNSLAQLQTALSDSDLTILFTTASLRGTTWNIATCPAGYDLDTSGGVSNYICKRTTVYVCL